MSIHEHRISRGWTQEQLAQHSGLSVRTIQRIENGHAATLESLKCLAAVFETQVSKLMQEQKLTDSKKLPKEPDFTRSELDRREKEAIEYVQNLKGFYVHCILFAAIMPCLYLLNLFVSPDELWVLLVAVAWLFGLGLHAVIMFSMFGLFGGAWEQRQFRRRMELDRWR